MDNLIDMPVITQVKKENQYKGVIKQWSAIKQILVIKWIPNYFQDDTSDHVGLIWWLRWCQNSWMWGQKLALRIRPHVMLTLQVYKCSQPKKKGVCTPTWQTAATPTPVAKSSSMPQHGARLKVALPGHSKISLTSSGSGVFWAPGSHH